MASGAPASLTGGADRVRAGADEHILAVEAGVEVSDTVERLSFARLRLNAWQHAKIAARLGKGEGREGGGGGVRQNLGRAREKTRLRQRKETLRAGATQ